MQGEMSALSSGNRSEWHDKVGWIHFELAHLRPPALSIALSRHVFHILCSSIYQACDVPWQVWAHISCLQNQMAQHPKQYRYNLEHYMCDLCQQELREQAANAASRSEQASPRNGLPAQSQKPVPALQSAFATEVCHACSKIPV